MMAKAFPNSHFVGYDFHPGSIEAARAHADAHGVLENARFEVGMAKDCSPTERLANQRHFSLRYGIAKLAGAGAGTMAGRG